MKEHWNICLYVLLIGILFSCTSCDKKANSNEENNGNKGEDQPNISEALEDAIELIINGLDDMSEDSADETLGRSRHLKSNPISEDVGQTAKVEQIKKESKDAHPSAQSGLNARSTPSEETKDTLESLQSDTKTIKKDGSVENSSTLEAEKLYREGMQLMEEIDLHASNRKLAFHIMQKAAEMGHLKAREFVALGTMLGWGFFQSLYRAHEAFTQLASEGNPRGQFGLAVMHAAGLMVNVNVPNALVYLTFSALGGDELAEMALAYRYYSGIGVEENCETALTYYYRVAKKVANYTNARVEARGLTYQGPTIHRIRLLDEVDSGSGPLSELFNGGTTGLDDVKNDLVIAGLAIDENVFQYHQLMADRKNVSAQLGLGLMYFHGKHGLETDYGKAAHYFFLASDGGSATAKAYIGEMYLHGIQPLEVNHTRALRFLKAAADGGSAIGQASLALVYLHGKAGVKPDPQVAMQLMSKAAEQGLPEAQLYLGRVLLSGALGSPPDYKHALRYFTLASQQGNLLAIYHIGEMHATGSGVFRSCSTATGFFKTVAERGRWSRWLMYAYSAHRSRLYDMAFATYQVLAELGYEVAQSNVAFMLEEGKTTLVDAFERYQRAFVQWQRSARQGSTSSRIKLGDYHYYGLGTEVSYPRALQHYKIASDVHHSPQAMFNLAYMHEQGLGMKRDLHLAKRLYDAAAQTSLEAKVPVQLALTRLSFYFGLEYLRRFSAVQALERMFFGSDNETVNPLGRQDESATRPKGTFSEASMDWDYYVIPLLAGLLLVLLVFLWQARR